MYRQFTDTGIEVTERIKNGKTIFTDSREEAKKLTEKAGYYYDVYDHKKNFIGFGIPK